MHNLPTTMELVLLDGAKALYPDILALVEPRLRSGALIITDAADASAACLTRIRAPDSGCLWTPVGEDVELPVPLA